MKTNQLIERDPEKLGGTPVFFGTRVPIKNLFDCLEGGEGLDEFLDTVPDRDARARADRVGGIEKLAADR